MNPRIQALISEREELYFTLEELEHNLREVHRRLETVNELIIEGNEAAIGNFPDDAWED